MPNSYVEFSLLDLSVFEMLRNQNEATEDFCIPEQLVAEFKICAPLQFLKIAKSVQQKNPELIKKETEVLRTTSLSLGAVGLGAFCEALEDAAEICKYSLDCQTLLGEIEVMLSLTIANLDARFPSYSDSPQKVSGF